MPEDSRKTALTILNAISENNLVTLDSQMDKFLGKGSTLERRDRALTTSLVYGVLRWREQIDFIIKHYSKTPFKKISHPILNALRLGIFQIKFMDKIPVSAAVNTSVNLSKPFGKSWAPKYVNGILRNVSRTLQDLSLTGPVGDQLSTISIQKSFPKWLLERWVERFGEENTILLCDAFNEIPPITLRTNLLKTTRDELLEKMKGEVNQLAVTAHSPSGVAIKHPKTSIPEMEPFINGLFQVQDEAAQLVSFFLSPSPGEKIMDACAGIGGKTAHIAQLMENKGHILASDLSKKKLDMLESEMKRLGISIVETMVRDMGKNIFEMKIAPFDKILIDAPCSGIGVIRKNPDTKWASQKKDLKRYMNQQLQFLNNAASLVRENGIIVYSVCSIEPEECEDVIRTFLLHHKNFVTDHPKDCLSVFGSLLDHNGYLKTFPHKHDMDGFFAARLKRLS